jgi:hypothetical protein
VKFRFEGIHFMQTITPPQVSTKASTPADKTRRPSSPRTSSSSKTQTLTPLQRYNRRPLLVLASRQTIPFWLKVLISLKQGVALSLLLSVVGVLGTYTWMADAQRQWGESYHRLRELERKERQLMDANELLKGHFADPSHQANSDLVPVDPTKAIFLKSSPARPQTWVETQRVKILTLPASY